MNGKKIRCAILAIVFILFWSSGDAALRLSPQDSQDINRLAELTHWNAGTIVADIGAGDGSYSFAAAQKLGPSGRVYATEIDREKLQHLRTEVTERKLGNIIVVEGTADDTKLPSSCCDTIFLRHVYHHLTQPQEFDKNLVRSLKPGAYLAIIDFPPSSDSSPVEGVPQNRGGHGIPEKVMEQELTTAGLQIEKVIDHWSADDYCVIFVKRAPLSK